MGEDWSVPALGVSCIHLLNVDSAISTSTEERSQCCISSNTWNAWWWRPNWRELLRRQMGLRDRRTLREWRVLIASSTHESHHAVGFSAMVVIGVRNREENWVGWLGCWVWVTWWCYAASSLKHILLTSKCTFQPSLFFFLNFTKITNMYLSS